MDNWKDNCHWFWWLQNIQQTSSPQLRSKNHSRSTAGYALQSEDLPFLLVRQKSSHWCGETGLQNQENSFPCQIHSRTEVGIELQKDCKVVSVNKGEIFEDLQNYNFFVLQGSNEEESRFTISDFPIMNPTDLIVLLDIMSASAGHEGETITSFRSVKAHVLSFLKNYMLRFTKFDIEIADLFGQSLAPPPCTNENFDHYKQGQIVEFSGVIKRRRNSCG